MEKVKVVIDNKADQTDIEYTYLCPTAIAKVGNVVKIPFGRGNREIRACIVEVIRGDGQKEESSIKLKTVIEATDISLTEEIVNTARWMKGRYYCRFFECLNLFIPSGKPPQRELADIHKEEVVPHKEIEELTKEQCKTLEEIKKAIKKEKQELFLIHGVTGSGKTQVYISAIEELIKNDSSKTAIMLVPEIALTKQIIDRFVKCFGKENIAVLHSRLTQKQRYKQWENIRSGQVKVVIGARSAIFAPLTNIGLIILDEEHESTYKSDKTPRYETIEVAIIRAKAFDGSVIMGSATPSIVTYQRAQEGIYKYLPMRERYNKVELPYVEIIDISDELKEGNKTSLSRRLYAQMDETLKNNKQIILFLNRRGYATYITCKYCDHIMKCKDCEVTLTYHKDTNSFDCHYCGTKGEATILCPNCKEEGIVQRGFGTEKVMEEVETLFPDKVVERLDLDTSKKAGFLEKTLKNFGKGKIHILMGTQIVAKGLDFHNVGLVGVLSADLALNIPDYRASERCFQLVTQAAGRAGRGNEKGRVALQTFNPDHYAISCGASQDYEGFYQKEIGLREFLCYPPFSDIVQIVISSNDDGFSKYNADESKIALVKMLGDEAKKNVFDPAEMISLDKKIYKYQIIVRTPREEKAKYIRAFNALRNSFVESKNDRELVKKDLQISIDTNPYNTLRG